MKERPTPERLAEIRGMHRESQSIASDRSWEPSCNGCGSKWPCSTALVLAALEEAQAENRRLLAALRQSPKQAAECTGENEYEQPCISHLAYLELEECLEAARKGLERIKGACEEDGPAAGEADRTIAGWAAAALRESEEPR